MKVKESTLVAFRAFFPVRVDGVSGEEGEELVEFGPVGLVGGKLLMSA